MIDLLWIHHKQNEVTWFCLWDVQKLTSARPMTESVNLPLLNSMNSNESRITTSCLPIRVCSILRSVISANKIPMNPTKINSKIFPTHPHTCERWLLLKLTKMRNEWVIVTRRVLKTKNEEGMCTLKKLPHPRKVLINHSYWNFKKYNFYFLNRKLWNCLLLLLLRANCKKSYPSLLSAKNQLNFISAIYPWSDETIWREIDKKYF